ncbi:hypothetical protein IQ06DRAFT_292996 [Phaeosphaeriaceae sp. SRC1lsM3a]|nr:hypothetical protein IQ06DRAFT_292996 [Stagonospora sp. SRC1lsM3a]
MPTALEEDRIIDSNGWNAGETPDLPYEEGFVLNALRHNAPQPFGLGYDTRLPPRPENWKKMSHLEYCLSYSPREGQTYSNLATSTAITSSIRTGPHQGAQIVVVNHSMVAKIYDPLFYPLINDYGTKNDVVRDADADYCREVTAFERLQQSTEAMAVTPAYYGSWTVMIETPVDLPGHEVTRISRPVRFILMELLSGISMAQIDASALRKEVRSLILEKTIIAESLLWDAGVDHRDFSPRNVMVLGSNYDNPGVPAKDIHVEVKLLDFNVAAVIDYPTYRYKASPRKKRWPTKLRSPILRHHGRMVEFSARGWCSDKDAEAEKWLWQHFGDDDRYVPVFWDADDPWTSPVYQRTPNANLDSGDNNDDEANEERGCSCGSSSKGSKSGENAGLLAYGPGSSTQGVSDGPETKGEDVGSSIEGDGASGY